MDAVIVCELCGAQARILCFCRKCSLCETCVGKHLLSEPQLGHKPVSFSQSEIAILRDKEFSQIREHEDRLLSEAIHRTETLKFHKIRIREEIIRLEKFEKECLEYIITTVERGKQDLVHAGETLGREVTAQCEEKKKELEEALRAVENGGKHWVTQALERDTDKTTLWIGKAEKRGITVGRLLQEGLGFELTMKKEETAVVKQTEGKNSQEKALRSSSPVKTAKRSIGRPEPSTPKTPNTDIPKPSRTGQRTYSSKKPAPLHRPISMKSVTVDEEPILPRKLHEYHSPEPVLNRALSFTPRASLKSSIGFSQRAALLQQTAKNVDEISDLVKAMKSSNTDSRPRTSMNFSDLSPLLSEPMTPNPTRSSMQFDVMDNTETTHKPGFPETIPEESSVKLKLYAPVPGSTQMIIRDIEAQTSTLKSFEGIEDFQKSSFWCVNWTGDVFILGGVVTESQASSIKRTCLIYSPVNDTLEIGPNMILGRYNCSATCLKDFVYVSGGVGSEMQGMKDCEKLEIRGRKWKKISGMNIARESHGMAVHASRLYVAGGVGEQSMETYNPVNDRWALLHFKVNARGKACMFSLGDKMAILHDKTLTFAWLERRATENVLDLQEKGWWTGGPVLKTSDSCYFLKSGAVYRLDIQQMALSKTELPALPNRLV